MQSRRASFHNDGMVAVFVLLLSSVACLNGPPHRAEPLTAAPSPMTRSETQTVELPVGTSAPVPGGNATITFVRVTEDSRCPTGTTCIWEGDAVAELRITPADAPAVMLELHTNTRFTREGRAGNTTVALERLDPHPAADAPVAAGSYRVTLKFGSN